MLSACQAGQYLERIGVSAATAKDVSAEGLSALVRLHQLSVPFETYEIKVLGRTPSLELDDLFEKIVIERRGGYCFELNKLFEALLKALGYKARPVLCRAVERTGRSPINHRGILVTIGNADHFVDVGYGGPMPAGALVLTHEGEQRIWDDVFIPRRIDDAWWAVDRITKSKSDFFDDDIPSRRQTELELCLTSVEDFDFNLLNVALSQPGELFRDHLLANIRTEKGYVAIMDSVLTVRKEGDKRLVELFDDAETHRALKAYFGIDYEGELRNV